MTHPPFMQFACIIVGQAVLVVLAFWAAMDSTSSSKKAQIARLDAEAAAAAAGHSTAILEKYVLELLPYATVLKNQKGYQQAVQKMPPEVAERFDWERVIQPKQKESLVGARRAFAELQRVAREVLHESAMYGTRYPEAMTAWANRTLEVDADTLPELLSGAPAGQAYAMLVGKATGVSWKKYQDAAARLSQ
ncbi:hypothetical protein [Eoetvoesiella caeni]|uniref:Uncharacterized protein n=1 Tax=Eoetvoesiella caeni TaxID=645616 RepID=A0A366HHF4_9BURK|nr:hypothetical protein [Eoetvoesiella caeni]MCI2808170.1 hypothetical protein [Eoetvoesiella caeni]NYT53827.1 hypothetical protein [Eoetvoesiella caeni]RBP42094.1 hypothetical protein DFR37_102480 [Eoetvoesiella caeni]